MKHMHTRISSYLVRGMLALATAAMLSACMAPAYVVAKVEGMGNDRKLKKGTERLRQYISELQAKGDPQGDYYYALGNSDGWIEDVKEPQAITRLFEQAATKGSMDAKILLALQEAMGQVKPGKLDFALTPRETLQGWESGLGKLLPLLQQQCFARRLVIDEGRPKVDYYTIAYYVWPFFRDGMHVQKNGQWELVIPKTPQRQALWEGIHRQCLMPQREFLDVDLDRQG